MDRTAFTAHKLRNALQTLGLLVTLAALLGYVAWVLGGDTLVWATWIAVWLLYLVNPAGSPRLVLALYQARPIHPVQAPRLHAVLAELTKRAELESAPRLYYLPTSVTSAFATGARDEAVIALSDGLLRRLDLCEIAAVLAHEVSHLANGDIRVMSLADLVSRITGLLGLMGQILLILTIPLVLFGATLPPLIPILVLLAAPTVSALVQLALSRNREYEADLDAVALTGDPESLASALLKLERQQGPFWEQLVMPGRRLPEPSLLRTHPPTEERVRRLMELASVRRDAACVTPWRLVDLGRDHWSENIGQPVHHRPRWRINGLWY